MNNTVLKSIILPAIFWLYSCSILGQEIKNVEALANDTLVHTIVEQMPQYPGGNAELIKFIATEFSNFRYTTDEYILGEFMVAGFIVEKDGTLSRIEMIRNTLPEAFGLELIRIIGTMPKWIPGKNQGVPVRVKYTLPFRLRLNQ